MGHLDEEALLQFVQHALSPEALAQAEAHLRTCSVCRRAVALLAESEIFLPDQSPMTPMPPQPSHGRGSGLRFAPGPSLAPGPGTGPGSGPSLVPSRPARRGKQIDRYVVLEVLGAGSMGIVYAAFDPQLDRKIALKMLVGDSPDRAESEEKRARMIREAQAMARLSHPNVVHVHDVGTFQDQIFVAMEFVQGQSLSEWLETEPRRTWREVLRVFIRAGRGLAAAHAAGLVHRDFKPDNVMVGNDGVARVMDFGLVSSVASDPTAWKTPAPLPLDRATSEEDLAVPLTRTGALLGTPAYMAPEQWTGDKIDHRADQFSFCVSLYEGLYGQRPFQAKTLSELTSKVAQGKIRDVPPGSPVPFYIRRAVARGLAADPRLRHPSMQELLQVLERGLKAPRRRVLYGAGGAALLVVSGALVGPALWRLRSPEHCGPAAAAFAKAWGSKERALAAAYLATGDPAAVEAWTHARRFIQRFGERWVASREQACHSGDSPPPLTQQRLVCLDEQLDELGALAEVLEKPDATAIRSAAPAAANLPSPEDCVGPGAHVRGQRDLRLALARARAALAVGDVAGARKLAEGALARAKGNRGMEAESLLALGVSEVAGGDVTAAGATFPRAMVAAEASGHARAGAEAAVALAELLGERGPPEQAEFFGSMAAAELERMGEDGPLRARAELGAARRLLQQRHPEAAEAAVQRALAILKRLHGEEHPAVAQAVGLLGRVEEQRGRLQQALASQRSAVTLLEKSLGRSHPAVAGALLEESKVERALGDAPGAAAHCRRAVELGASADCAAMSEASGRSGP